MTEIRTHQAIYHIPTGLSIVTHHHVHSITIITDYHRISPCSLNGLTSSKFDLTPDRTEKLGYCRVCLHKLFRMIKTFRGRGNISNWWHAD